MRIEGYDKLIKDLKALGTEGKEAIALVTAESANKIEVDAKQTAASVVVNFNGKDYRAKDLGGLGQNILAREVDKLNWKVYANAFGTADYSAYVEFGTGGLVEVPDELQEMAIQFKGAGIKEVNLPARPYLYPAFVRGREKYIDELKKELDYLTKNI